MNHKPKIVVLGLMAKMPVAGIVWLTIPYLIGLRQLGYDVYYVEAHARTPSMFMEREDDDESALAAAFIEAVMQRFGFADHWAYHALHSDGRIYGMSHDELRKLYASAELIVNLHGGTEPTDEHTANDRLILIETDPVEMEIELHDGDKRAWDFLDAHSAVFTWGQNFGHADCRVPVPGNVIFQPTRMPILLGEWDAAGIEPGDALTTVGNWEQPWREITFEGTVYTWSKHHEFLKFIDLPSKVDQRFELALASCPDDARQLLDRHGWRVRPAAELSHDVDIYRDYIRSSRGEFTVAKDQNVRLRSGWFSDRSAAYLAAGRPVITQETGFSNTLPTGEGLFGFSTLDEIVAAVEALNSDYARHSRAALEIAREYFDARKVLRSILTEVGLPAFPPGLSLAVTRSPTALSPETVATIDETVHPARSPAALADPSLSVVIVVIDGLPFTRLCLESLLADPLAPPLEVIVVSNGSQDGTGEYVRHLSELDARVRLVENDHNVGFAAAVNQGIAISRAPTLLLLNNDTITPPGAIARLVKAAEDPTVGLVGPVSNRASSEAEVSMHYTDLDGLYHEALGRTEEHGGETFDLEMLTMFCVAMRREVYDLIGPLDERFEVGLFEDDDYSLRVREAGLRVICLSDTLVHHFGEGSFGSLVESGGYAKVFEVNRRRFEEKWQRQWPPREKRQPSHYRQLVEHVRAVVSETVPAGAKVLVMSKGDEALIQLEGRAAGHFPQVAGGVYAGHYPADATDAIAQLDGLGAEFLVVPRTSLWWLDHYEGLRQRLEGRCVRADTQCSIFDLGGHV